MFTFFQLLSAAADENLRALPKNICKSPLLSHFVPLPGGVRSQHSLHVIQMRVWLTLSAIVVKQPSSKGVVARHSNKRPNSYVLICLALQQIKLHFFQIGNYKQH